MLEQCWVHDHTPATVCLPQIDGISPTDVESTSVSLTPQVDYGSNGSTQNITGDSLQKLCLVGQLLRPLLLTGYEFTNGISVKVNNVTGDLLASVTDSAVNAGGNDVTIGSFTVSGKLCSCSLSALSCCSLFIVKVLRKLSVRGLCCHLYPCFWS